MITNATDYQYVTPVGQINGGILPARDVAADGSSSVFRAEDLCFATEAVDERLSISRGSTSRDLPVPTLALYQLDWDAIWYNLSYCLFHGSDSRTDRPRTNLLATAIDPNAVFAPGDYNELFDHLNDYYPGSVMASHYHAYPQMGFAWDNDCVRGFYYDLEMSDRVCFISGWPITGTLTTTKHDEDVTTTTSESFYALSDGKAQFGYAYRTGTRRGRKRVYTGVTGGSLTFTLPLSDKAASAELVWVESITGNYHAEKPDAKTIRSYRTRHVDLTWNSAGTVTIPSAVFVHSESQLEEIASDMGLDFPFFIASTEYSDIPGALNVQTRGAWLIVTYDFRTEIRSLNWQWQPS